MSTTYLKHHGILGQKWGVRNGPPYPLDSRSHSISERQSGWQKSLSPSSPSKSQSSNSGGSGGSSSLPKSLMSKKAGDVSPAVVELGLSMAAMFAYWGAMRLVNNAVYKNDIKKNVNDNDLSHVRKITTKHSQDDDMKVINPGYSSGKTKYRMNCTMCSTAYELRRRGYDVEANTTTQGRYSKDVASWFGLSKKDIHTATTYDDFYDEIHKEPDGSRGQVLLGVGAFDSKHSMVWEKENGHVTIRDCQSGIKYDSMANSIINKNSRLKYEYIRTDNAQVDLNKMTDAVRAREKAAGGTNGRKKG